MYARRSSTVQVKATETEGAKRPFRRIRAADIKEVLDDHVIGQDQA